MRPTQAKDHPAASPPRPIAAVPGASLPRRPVAGGGEGHHGTGAWSASGPLPDGPAEVRRLDADVPGAVGRLLDQVLRERLRRARLADPLFAEEVAERVTRFTLRGGKRTRAQLVWWAARACAGGDPAAAAAALRTGAAVELLQTCALVQDDVMDQAVLRRGRPALHAELTDRYADRAGVERARRFGQSAAVLAGDLALAWADDVVAETPLEAWTGVVVRRLWSDMRTEMVAGQFLDVQGQVTGVSSLARVLRAARLKSALYSVERPLALGAAVAGADDVTLRRLCDAGRCVGLAFQLRDDLDDVFGDPRETGKARGGDIREGKPTYLVTVARARAEAAGDTGALAVLDRWLGDPALTESALREVRDVLVATGARATVEAKVDRLAAQGLRHFDGAALHPEGAGPLRALLLATAGARPGADAAVRPGEDAAARDIGAWPGADTRDSAAWPGDDTPDSAAWPGDDTPDSTAGPGDDPVDAARPGEDGVVRLLPVPDPYATRAHGRTGSGR